MSPARLIRPADRGPWYRSIRVRPWRKGDRPQCSWAGHPRRHEPPCADPVAVAIAENPHGERRRYALCEMHRRMVYDGRPPIGAEVYRLGSEAYRMREGLEMKQP